MHAYIPSPSRGVFHLGPLPLRMYAFCIIIGVVVAVYLGERRAQARGLPKGVVGDMATVAVPVGLVGARLYHVITSPAEYFGKHGHPIEALYVWRGGLGIWGGVLAGALGAYVYCRRKDIPFVPLVDAVGPCVAVAQAVGRFGNYFNQELFGRASDLPWALRIDCAHVPPSDVSRCTDYLTYHPTFLYEAIWDLLVFAICIRLDRRLALHAGRVMALYVALYTFGRGIIETARVDEANHFFGIRLNVFTSIVAFLGAVVYLIAKRNAPPDVVPDRAEKSPSEAPISPESGG